MAQINTHTSYKWIFLFVYEYPYLFDTFLNSLLGCPSTCYLYKHNNNWGPILNKYGELSGIFIDSIFFYLTLSTLYKCLYVYLQDVPFNF